MDIQLGEWIEDDYGYNRCSECGFEYDTPEEKSPYCPHCGALMEPDPEEIIESKELSDETD